MTNNEGELQSLRNGDHRPRVVSGMNRPYKPKPLGEQGKAVRRQELMVLLANLGMFATGMGLALPAVTLTQLTDPNEPVHLDKSQASWFASVNSITCPIGALLTAYMLDKIGRKRTLIAVNCVAITSWALMALAVQDDSQSVFIQLIVSRCIIGIGIGMGSAPPGVYGAEISLPKIRGRLILGVSISVSMGILFIYTVGYFIRDDWHLIALIMLGYQIVCLVILTPIPESPSWLMSKGRAIEAKRSLTYFRGLQAGQKHEEVEFEFALLQKTSQRTIGEKKTPFVKSLRLKEVYKPLLIMIGLFCCQQFSGIFVVVVYAVQIAIEAGVNIDPILCAVFIGLARVITTCMMGWLLEKWGRRLAGMISAFGMAVCMFLLAGSGWFTWLDIPYLPAAAIVIYIIASTLGLYTLPFFMISEVFPQKVRGACAGVTGCFGLLMSFFVLKAYPTMVDEMGNANVFAFYGVMSLLSILFVFVFLPETKGKTLLEIEEYFRTGKKGVRQREMEVEMKEVFVMQKV